MRSLKRRGYDQVLVSHALPCGTAALIAKILGGLPYSVLMHGLDLRLALRSTRKRFLLKFILSHAKAVFVNSEVVSQEVQSFRPQTKPIVITPGVEAMTFPPRETARTSFGIADGEIVILSVTRLISRKGIDRLIEAMGSLPSHIRLVVIGDGIDRARLVAQASSLGERFQILSHVEDSERNAWYAAADIFAMPVRDEGDDVEGFGIVFLEAALAGLPVVAGKSGGAVEAVNHGETGLLVDPNNVSALVDDLKRLTGDAHLRKQMGAAGRARVMAEFRWDARWDKMRQTLGL
jgi:phosphatidylinositol alpha-1,6-mannosyltransferase